MTKAQTIMNRNGWSRERVRECIIAGINYESEHPLSAPIERFYAARMLSGVELFEIFGSRKFKQAEQVVSQALAGKI